MRRFAVRSLLSSLSITSSHTRIPSATALRMDSLSTTPSSAFKPRIAVAQMTSTSDRAHNLQVCESLIQQAKAKGVHMIFLPECFSLVGDRWQDTVAAGQALDGEIIRAMQAMARRAEMWLSLGGFPEKTTLDGVDKVFNTHLIIDDLGSVQAVYRKIHLFDVEVPNGPVMLESRYTAPGSDVVVADSVAGKLGLSTCYDVRFPEMYISLVKAGAQVILVPSAFTVPTGKAHWETLLRARAIESQCYVLAAAQVGQHNAKRESYGHAMIIDPWGRVLEDAGGEASPVIITADLDLEMVASIRQKIPIEKHRRPDIFSKF